MDEESAQVFLPPRERCFERLRLARFGETVTCVTIFWQHRFGLEEMFYIVKEMRSEPTAQIARDLDRDYEAVLNFVHKVQDVSGDIDEFDLYNVCEADEVYVTANFVHKVQDVSGDIDEFDLYNVCEADEVYVTAGEKGLEDENGSPRSRGLFKKGRGTFGSDKPPVLTLVRRDDGRVRFLVCENLQDADEDIAEYGDGSVILCTDGYTIYDDIEDKEGVDGHLAVTHSETYVIGDAHTNTCENRHSFLRQWLAKFRGVSKHHLQKYLGFLELKLNSPNDWFEKLLCYDVSG
ncbi:IS1595 family transposase [Halococcus salifodinae]|uniref:IS1595 family transposase n=1 Tax=Halococcus salifodinae TaxID=36738 RepID=UPI000A2F886C|nr:IS1595 family transposase [Halococcus salifodinae]